jgi:hypothetical protein
MGENWVLLNFEDEINMERVITNGPWSFDKFFILLQRIEDDSLFSQVSFTNITLWAQIHDLLVCHIKPETGWTIGGTLGKVERVDSEDETRGGSNFVRVRLSIDVQAPLCRGRKVGFGGGREALVSFKYERLPNFCYWCWLLTHGDSDYGIWLRSQGSLPERNQQYGPWMRSSIGRPNRRYQSEMGRSNTQDKTNDLEAKSPHTTTNLRVEISLRSVDEH